MVQATWQWMETHGVHITHGGDIEQPKRDDRIIDRATDRQKQILMTETAQYKWLSDIITENSQYLKRDVMDRIEMLIEESTVQDWYTNDSHRRGEMDESQTKQMEK